MSLLAVLLAVVLQYFAEKNNFLAVPNRWIAGYWRLISDYLVNVGWQIGLVVAALPVLLSLFALRLISVYLLHGMLDFAIILVVLLVTLQIRNYSHMLANYTQALSTQNWQRGLQIVCELTGDASARDFTQANQQLRRWVLIDLFKNWFVGLFWFGIFGVYGVTTYWLLRKLATQLQNNIANHIEWENADNDNSHDDSDDGDTDNQLDEDNFNREYLMGLGRYLYWAEYLPVRLWIAGYALVGEFVPTFDWLAQEMWHSLTSEEMIEYGSALALGYAKHAVNVDVDAKETKMMSATKTDDTLIVLQQTIRLNKRLFIICLVLIIFSGVWAFLI